MLGFEWHYPSIGKRKLLYPWTCRECTGIGTLNLGYEQAGCFSCDGTGFRFPSDAFNHWMSTWRYIWRSHISTQFLAHCLCGDVNRVLWFKVGNHDDCIPF